jgi:putative endonuclease
MSKSSPSAKSEDPRRALGAHGEALTAKWYEAQGYTVVDRNWRCREGEIDLILARASAVVFCEVKARTSDRFGAPVEAVTRTKQLRLRRLAAAWLSARGVHGVDVRFDVASVMGERVQVIEAAF